MLLHPTRETPLSIAALAALLLAASGACSDSHANVVDSSTSGARGDDARIDEEPEPDEDPRTEPGDEPDGEGDEPDAEGDDSGPGSEDEDAGAGATTDAGAEELDAAADGASPEVDAGDPGDAGAGDAQLDAAVPAEDAAGQADASAPDAGGCPAGQPADACGVCGGDGASCRHPLAGRYAARTQFFAHQHAASGEEALDLISKGNILSIVSISDTGLATEHYCFIEMASADPIYMWGPASAVQQIPDTSVELEEREGGFVRPLAKHRAYFGWSPQAAPTDCVAGQTHSSGCLCGAPDALPASADDCRVLDVGGDPGASMYLDLAPPADVDATSPQLELELAALLSLEWRLGQAVDGQVVGEISGGLQTSVLDIEGALAASIGAVENAMCDESFGHVELVRGEFDCATLLAGRSAEPPLSYDVFDVALDPQAPASPALCQTPAGS